MFGIPGMETHIDLAPVAALIREQFPQHAGRSLQHSVSGWGTAILTLGSDGYLTTADRRLITNVAGSILRPGLDQAALQRAAANCLPHPNVDRHTPSHRGLPVHAPRNRRIPSR